jgi:hypothetical protein
MRKECLCLLTPILLLAHAAVLPAVQLNHVTASLIDNRVEFKYDLDGSDKETEVTLCLNVPGTDNASINPHLEGDLGKVYDGPGKTILWDVLKDYPRGLNAEIDWEIFAGPAFNPPPKGVWGRLKVNVAPVSHGRGRGSW